MKKIIFILVFILAVIGYSIASPDYLGNFNQGNEEYKKGNYDKALVFYEKINISSPELYFNMGQCFYNLEYKGKALYYYTLANKLSPRDKKTIKVLTELKNELTRAGAVINTPEKLPVIDFFSLNEMFTVLFIFIIIVFTAAIVNIKTKKDRFWFYFICWTIIFLVSISIVISISKNSEYVIIVSTSAEIRYSQDIDTKPFTSVLEGSELKVFSKENGWVMVAAKLDGSSKGWIPEKDVLVVN